MNKQNVKKIIRYLMLTLVILFITNTMGFSEKKKSEVNMSWQQFRQLLNLDKDDITLTWNEFNQLLAQTGETKNISYSVQNGKVVLPRKQFSQLLDKMKPPRTDIKKTPAEYVISKAIYTGKMSKTSTTLNATFSLEIFEKAEEKYFQVPILPRSAGLAEVLIDGQPALVMEKNGWYSVATPKTGHHQIKAKYYIASHLEKGPRILNLPVVKTAITLLQLAVPMEKVDLTIPGAREIIVTRNSGTTVIDAVIPATNTITVQAHRKYVSRKEAQHVPAKIYAETINLISIEEDALRVTSRIKLNILQNSITRVEATLPKGYTILYIRKTDGSRIRDWRIKKDQANTIVDIPFNSPVKGNFTFDILSEKLFNSQQEDIHFTGYHIIGAIRETGYIGAEKKSTAEATPVKTDKLDRIDIKDLPYELVSMSKRPLLFGYRYLRHPYNLEMSVTRHQELPTMSTVIDLASVITVVLEDGKTLTRVSYTIRNTWKQFLKLDLPPGSEVWTVYVDGKRENASQGSDGKIMVPLARSQTRKEQLQSFTLEIIYFSKGKPLSAWGRRNVQFPTADIMVSKMLWSVYLPQDFFYYHFKGNVEKEEIASTMNLLFGNKRNFSLDQVGSYNEVAVNIEKAPRKQKRMNKYQQSIQSNFSNSAIQQKDIANQMRQEASLNAQFQKEQGKRLGQPGSGSRIFKIELPTSGQIYRFNKTIVEAEPIELTLYYTSATIKTIFKGFFLVLIIGFFYIARNKLFAIVRGVYRWFTTRQTIIAFLGTTTGLRTSLFMGFVLFFFISHFLFVVFVLLFLIALFRPHWLVLKNNKEEKLNIKGEENE